MTAHRCLPPALVWLLALALPAPLWAADLPTVTTERGAITDLNDDDRLTIEAGGAVRNTSGRAITGSIPTPDSRFPFRGPNNISITNRGLIEGNTNAIVAGSDLRLDNSKTIKSGSGSAVIGQRRAIRLINRAGAEISSARNRGINFALGIDRLENAGIIRGAGSSGAEIGQAGTVINEASGVIEGPFGIVASSVNSLINRGTITGTSESGIALTSESLSSGALTNSGTIMVRSAVLTCNDTPSASSITAARSRARPGTAYAPRARSPP